MNLILAAKLMICARVLLYAIITMEQEISQRVPELQVGKYFSIFKWPHEPYEGLLCGLCPIGPSK